jgi:MoCo/4Fe-4S cofactor protein with predicted Tat translocation signal
MSTHEHPHGPAADRGRNSVPDPVTRPALEELRDRLAGQTGEKYWRSLDELADNEEFRSRLQHEFPRDASVWEDAVSRRRFLQLMGASIALAGLSSCVKQPDEKIVPYVRQPEILVPGKPMTFASAFELNGFATGILVTSHMGRPTKIQGNPDHPASLGSSDIHSQASILHLYDPDRSQVVRRKNEISTQDKFLAQLQGALDAQKALSGAGLRILTGTVASPTVSGQIEALLELYPKARWHRYDTTGLPNEREGARKAFGEPVQTVYRFDRADIVVSLDADFLAEGNAHVRHSRDFSARRKITGGTANLNRLYVAESFPTVTGGVADHRLPVKPGRVARLATWLAAELGVPLTGNRDGGHAADSGLNSDENAWLIAAVSDLKKASGRSIVVAGPGQPPDIHALAHRINSALGNFGETVTFVGPPEFISGHGEETLGGLVADMNSGSVDLLLVAGCNPSYDAPADLDFPAALKRVPMSVSHALYADETARACTWHVPQSHYLEAWGDARAFDGTASIVQPLIAPLYNTMSFPELLSEFLGKPGGKGYDIVREYWRGRSAGDQKPGAFEEFWRKSLNDGVIAGTAAPPVNVRLKPGSERVADGGDEPHERPSVKGLDFEVPGGNIEVVFRPDPNILDGQFSNNGWLQELPRPVSKLTWDNAAFLSPSLAIALQIEDEDIVEVGAAGARVKLPALVMPGHPTDTVTLHLGFGRTGAGKVADGTGVNVHPLRTTGGVHFARGSVRKAAGKRKLARTQDHNLMEGRPIFRTATVAEFELDPRFAREQSHNPTPSESLYPEKEYDGYKWGMSIDLNACTGCNACVIACQSENNIPVVGKEEVLNGREMHWIRIDRYYSGNMNNPAIYNQPVACMHCENAPCEPVCPVGATNHDSEGLNVMVYNRCVGTRYCSNNCPYKVRRFNFLQYADKVDETVQMMYNPDVTVRNRGVMEKCTYCVQRISAARIEAKKEDRAIREGEVTTACQSACPAQAITFGDLNDPESAVSKAKAEPRDYGLLTELNTHPRTSYLARISNPNPTLDGKA